LQVITILNRPAPKHCGQKYVQWQLQFPATFLPAKRHPKYEAGWVQIWCIPGG